MPDTTRPDIKAAQAKARSFLTTLLSDIRSDIRPNSFFSHEYTTDVFTSSEWEHHKIKIKDPTVRHFLGSISQDLDDLFVLEETRNEARQKHPKEYEGILREGREDPDKESPVEKWIKFMDAIINLADNGTRPSKETLLNGIKILQKDWHRLKTGEAGHVAYNNAESLEQTHYHYKTYQFLHFADKHPNFKKPKWMSEEIYQEIKLSIPSAKKNDELNEKVNKCMCEHMPMKGSDYRRFYDLHTTDARGYAKMADISLHVIRGIQGIATDLGIDVRSQTVQTR